MYIHTHTGIERVWLTHEIDDDETPYSTLGGCMCMCVCVCVRKK
jgi:hypothetical protein